MDYPKRLQIQPQYTVSSQGRFAFSCEGASLGSRGSPRAFGSTLQIETAGQISIVRPAIIIIMESLQGGNAAFPLHTAVFWRCVNFLPWKENSENIIPCVSSSPALGFVAARQTRLRVKSVSHYIPVGAVGPNPATICPTCVYVLQTIAMSYERIIHVLLAKSRFRHGAHVTDYICRQSCLALFHWEVCCQSCGCVSDTRWATVV